MDKTENVVRTISHWRWNQVGYWECEDCKGPSDALMDCDNNCDPYIYINTRFCGRCGARMEAEKE